MAVNPLSPAMPYSVNASNETSDNSRQRQDKNPQSKDSKLKLRIATEDAAQNTNELNIEKTFVLEASELTSQIIDSSKVIELLSHRPKLKKSVRNCFITTKTPPEKSQITDIKKYNKAF